MIEYKDGRLVGEPPKAGANNVKFESSEKCKDKPWYADGYPWGCGRGKHFADLDKAKTFALKSLMECRARMKKGKDLNAMAKKELINQVMKLNERIGKMEERLTKLENAEDWT